MSESLYSGRVRTRGCALVTVDEKLLLVKQNVPTRKEPIWLPPGGEIELGESAKDAAKRETFEETGLIVKPTHLAAVHEFIEPPFHAVELYFLAEAAGGNLQTGIDPELNNNRQHILKCEFIPLGELKTFQVYPDFIKKIDKDSTLFTADNTPHFITRSGL